jgi:hypothetical protein
MTPLYNKEPYVPVLHGMRSRLRHHHDDQDAEAPLNHSQPQPKEIHIEGAAAPTRPSLFRRLNEAYNDHPLKEKS